ncbi:MAG TPA: hypothetical protein VGR88_07380, partial [Ktedonobacterales bacterium]|nr:hypothetical protein [Ktedonobacterales bacterium]
RMSPQDVAQAITQALVQGGSQFAVATIVAFLPVMWTTTLMLHLGRPYVLRTLRRCGLRLGADVWWMSYLLMRDAFLLITFALSFIYFNPNLVASMPFPITGPLATLALLLALAVKLARRVDDDAMAYRWSTIFLIIGATLYYLPLAFAVEANSQSHLSWFQQNLVSNVPDRTQLALAIMWISLAGVAAVAVWIFFRALASANRTMKRRLASPSAATTIPEKATVAR